MTEPSVTAALVSGAVVAAATPLVKRIAPLFGQVAHPKTDRWHTRAVPLLGGVALFSGVVAALAVTAPPTSALLAVLVTATGMFGLGLVDDGLALPAGTKLIGQIVIACVAVVFGAAPPWTSSGAFDATIAIFWIVGITNALNLLDNMDGLCAGIASIASFGCWMGLIGISEPLSVCAAALFGATAAFLFYNFRPASIFMGDCGSLFLGGSLAVLSLAVSEHSGGGMGMPLAIPIFLLLIPIFDTVFVTLSRVLSTRPPSRGGKDHTSHRLVAMGFSESQAVLFLWMLAAAGAGIAVLHKNVGPFGTVLLAALLLVALTLLAIQLAKIAAYDGADFSLLIGKRYSELLVHVTYNRRIFEMLLDVLLVSLAYSAAYVIRFDRDVSRYYALIRQSLPLIIGCQLASLFLVGVYRGTWRHMSLSDLTTYGKGIGLGVLSSVMLLVYVYRFEGYSRGVFVIDALLLAFLIPGSRLSFRLIGDAAGRRRQSGAPTLIYGAGDAGALLLTELRNNRAHGLRAVAFMDDDVSKWRKRMLRLPILGGIDDLEKIIARDGIEVVVVSTTKLPVTRAHELARMCHASGTRLLHLRLALQEQTMTAGRLDG